MYFFLKQIRCVWNDCGNPSKTILFFGFNAIHSEFLHDRIKLEATCICNVKIFLIIYISMNTH